jgi:hypothetical protein
MIPKYTRGSKIHRALAHLGILPREPNDLVKLINFGESATRLQNQILSPLKDDGFARWEGDKFVITELGKEKLLELGQIKNRLPGIDSKPKHIPLNLRDYLSPIFRVGADDHEQYPSRVGDSLFYRDGRVVQL